MNGHYTVKCFNEPVISNQSRLTEQRESCNAHCETKLDELQVSPPPTTSGRREAIMVKSLDKGEQNVMTSWACAKFH